MTQKKFVCAGCGHLFEELDEHYHCKECARKRAIDHIAGGKEKKKEPALTKKFQQFVEIK